MNLIRWRLVLILFSLSVVLGLFLNAQFTDVAHSDLPLCPGNYSAVENCANYINPIRPSIERIYEAPDIDFANNVGAFVSNFPMRDIDKNAYQFNGFWGPSYFYQQPTKGQMHIFPYKGTSNDGRLVMNGDGSLDVFRPELMDYGYKNLFAGEFWRPNSRHHGLQLLHYVNPFNTDFDWVIQPAAKWADGFYPATNTAGATMCDGSDWSHDGDMHGFSNPSHKFRNPRRCQARETATSPLLNGDCYDITTVHMLHSESQGPYVGNFEIRSAPKTVFVGNGKSVSAGSNWNELFIYPRMIGNLLPAYDDYRIDWQPNRDDYIQKAWDNCRPAIINKPGWCAHLTQQNVVQDFTNYNGTKTPTDSYYFDWNGNNTNDAGEGWDSHNSLGTDAQRTPSEPTITGDGMLLIVHDTTGKGLLYSYNKIAPCRADGWTVFKPISFMPEDSQVNQKYGLAKVHHRDVEGREYQPGDLMLGAYPWISRKGTNLFYAKGSWYDSYFAHSQIPQAGYQPSMSAVDYYPGLRGAAQVFVLGSYTRGKEIISDTRLTYTSFGGRIIGWGKALNPNLPANQTNITGAFQFQFGMKLYSDNNSVTLQPKPNTNMNSPEGVFNYYDALSPNMPFDVVWNISSTAEQNAELIFDDYVNTKAVIVAHMNESASRSNEGWTDLKHGFEGTTPGSLLDGQRNTFLLKKSPKLQNASTSTESYIPTDLDLLGGARVEPVNNGVFGKALFLDGANDHIRANIHTNDLENFLITMWLESKESVRNKYRTILEFTDGSFIAMSLDSIIAYNPGQPLGKRIIRTDISSLLLTNKYFHFAVSSVTDINTKGVFVGRQLKYFINGTLVKLPSYLNNGTGGETPITDIYYPVQSESMAQAGFLFNGNGYFVVGSDGRTVTDFQKFPFKGWVDELRVYTGGIRNIPEDNYLYESICNLAMGSLVKINDMDYYRPAHPKLKLLADAAVKYGLLGLAKPIFNDPNIISTVGPVQGGTTIATKPILTNINLVPVGGTNPPSTVVTRPNLNNVNLIAVNSGTTTSTSTPVQYVAKNIPFVLVKNKIPTLINTNTTDSSGRSAASTPSNTSTESNTGSSTTQARMMSQTNAPRGLTGVYVCEQLDYTVNNYPSEIAPQDMTNILCATRVHRNPHTNAMIASKCARKVVLGIKNSPIKHGFARPDFSQNQFCLSCHMDSNENPALKMEALESYPNILRQEDERRQPMDHIPFVSGCTPVNIPSLTAANGSYCAPSGADLYLDQIFDFQGKIRPYGK